MRSIISLLIAMIMISCGQDLAECKGFRFQEGGLNVCSEGNINSSDVKQVVRIVEEEVKVRYPKVKNLEETFEEHGVYVHLVDDPLATYCEELSDGVYRCKEHIGGANVGGDIIYVQYNKCLAVTSLGHELLHSIEAYYLEDERVEDHKTPWLFEIGENPTVIDTVEYKTFERLFMILPACEDLRKAWGWE